MHKRFKTLFGGTGQLSAVRFSTTDHPKIPPSPPLDLLVPEVQLLPQAEEGGLQLMINL